MVRDPAGTNMTSCCGSWVKLWHYSGQGWYFPRYLCSLGDPMMTFCIYESSKDLWIRRHSNSKIFAVKSAMRSWEDLAEPCQFHLSITYLRYQRATQWWDKWPIHIASTPRHALRQSVSNEDKAPIWESWAYKLDQPLYQCLILIIHFARFGSQITHFIIVPMMRHVAILPRRWCSVNVIEDIWAHNWGPTKSKKARDFICRHNFSLWYVCVCPRPLGWSR